MLYPIAIEKGDDVHAFGVIIPDIIGCYSAGDSFEEALTNAKDAIETHLELLAEDGDLPPMASSIDTHYGQERFTGWIWALCEVDIDPYMGKANKLNITLPKLLTKRIDDVVKANDNYKTRSHFLQVAACHEIEQVTR
jgi:predicted RNase H-like HicB family nuclease